MPPHLNVVYLVFSIARIERKVVERNSSEQLGPLECSLNTFDRTVSRSRLELLVLSHRRSPDHDHSSGGQCPHLATQRRGRKLA